MVSLELCSLFELEEQTIIGTQREGQAAVVIVTRICLQVLDDIRKQVSPLHPTAWGFVVQRGEVDVEVIVRGLIVQIHPQFAGRDTVTLLNGVL